MMLQGREFPGREGLKAIWGTDDTNEAPADEGIPDKRDLPHQDGRIDRKDGYGFPQRRVSGRRVLAVDDTLTTGDSIMTLVAMLRESGAEVRDAAVVADRSDGRAAEVARALGVTIHRLFEFRESNGLLVPVPGPFRPNAV